MKDDSKEFLRKLDLALRAQERLLAHKDTKLLQQEILDTEKMTGKKFHGFGWLELIMFGLTGKRSMLTLDDDITN